MSSLIQWQLREVKFTLCNSTEQYFRVNHTAVAKPARFLFNFHIPWAYHKLSNQSPPCSPWDERPALHSLWSENMLESVGFNKQRCWNRAQSNMTGGTRIWPSTADPIVLFYNAVFLGRNSQVFLPAFSWHLPWGPSCLVPPMTVWCRYKRIAQTVYARILAAFSTGNGEGKSL